LDALSYGKDRVPMTTAGAALRLYDWYFSVDEFATGIPGTPAPPSVWTQGPPAPAEASADIYVDAGLGFMVPCAIGPVGNTAVIDGNGVGPFGGPGLGLMEPNPPTPGLPADP